MSSTAGQASIPGHQAAIDIYARVSRKGDRKQRSTGGQVSSCRAVLAERGLAAGEVLMDDGRSAWNPRVKRDGWDKLMTRLESGASGGVIVFDLERFTRQPKEGERLIDAAERGLTVLDSDAEFDLTTASGKKAFRDAMAAAAYYSDRLSDRVKRGKKAKAMAGEVDNGGQRRAFGFQADNVTVDEHEAEVIRFAAGHVLHGDPQLAIVNHLNRLGIRTAWGGTWTVHSLAMMLTRERNRGNITHAGVVVARLPGEPVLSDDTYERLLAVYAARRRGRPPSDVYLATGMVVCSECRGKLGGRPVPQKLPYDDGATCREYHCPRSAGGCGKVRADWRELDAAARELALTILSDKRNAAAIEAAAASVAEETTTLDSLIAQDEETALVLSGRLGRKEITLPRYDAIMGPLDDRLARLRQQRAKLAAPEAVPARQSRAAWDARWEAATPGERRDLLKMALRGRHLVIAPAGTGQASHALTDVRHRITVS